MMEDSKFFQCQAEKSRKSTIETPNLDGAIAVLHCNDCSLKKLSRCKGPLEVDKPKLTEPIVTHKKCENKPKVKQESSKRRGRPPKAKPEVTTTNNIAKSTNEEKCRQALLALAVPLHPNYADMVAPFRHEIQAARAAGRGWDVISKTLKQYGYKIGVKALVRLKM